VPGYDEADRLTGVTVMQGGSAVQTFAYAYDDADNRTMEQVDSTRRDFYYNALNQITSISNSPITGVSYEWDAANRLVAINNGTHRSEFGYNGHGRRDRITEKENGTTQSDVCLLWCGLDLCEQRNAGGDTVLKRYFQQGLSASSDSDTPAGSYYCFRDHLGSARILVDGLGAIRAAYTYEPYGRQSQTSGDLHAEPGFAGLWTHLPTGTSLASFRSYAPALGRWISRDPAMEGGGVNLFAYSGDDPADNVDPLGLEGDSADNAISQGYSRWDSFWKSAPPPLKWVKSKFEGTKYGKPVKEIEEGAEKIEEGTDLANDVQDIREAEADPCLSEPEKGAVWLKKGLKHLADIPGVNKVPFLKDYLKAMGNGASQTLDEGEKHAIDQRDNGTINRGEIEQLNQLNYDGR
jgi:RHS repeat-associated protein